MKPLSANHYEAIVVGVGSMGAATAYYLAKEGAKVLALEQFELVHEQGSHAGQSRLIRKAYAEHPDYVPLLERAYQNWRNFEQHTGAHFFNQTGIAYFGKPDAPFLEDIRSSASIHGLSIEALAQEQAQKRFPCFDLPSHHQAIWEPSAGFVTPEKAIAAFVRQAQALGAHLHENETVLAWHTKGTQIEVVTNQATYITEKLIITAGAYAQKLLPQLQDKLKITRQLLTWVKPGKNFDEKELPCWMYTVDDMPGSFYGFPQLSPDWLGGKTTQVMGVKIAYHVPGQPVNSCDLPLAENPTLIAQEKQRLREFATTYLPGLLGDFLLVKHCLYTYSPDGHFIIDYLPGFEQQVIIAAGFSGHGFKFAPLVGEVLTDLALKGKTEQPIGFLALDRLAQIQDKT